MGTFCFAVRPGSLPLALRVRDEGYGLASRACCSNRLVDLRQMAEGTSYAIVPYMIPEQLPVVSAMVGAGGTLGAVIATRMFYMTTDDDLLPFKYHAAYVMFWAFTCFFMRGDHLGSMFGGPRTPCPEVSKNQEVNVNELRDDKAVPNRVGQI